MKETVQSTMLRITVHDKQSSLTFQLEGMLAGAWVPELERCWQGTIATNRGRATRIDLTGVTFVDAPGKELLAALHRQGAEFLAAGCLMKAIVAQITNASDCGGAEGEGASQP